MGKEQKRGWVEEDTPQVPFFGTCTRPQPLGGPRSGAEAYLLGGRGGEAALEEEAVLLAQLFARGARNDSLLVLVALGREGRERSSAGAVQRSSPIHLGTKGVSRETWGIPNTEVGVFPVFISSPASPWPWVQHQDAVPETTASPQAALVHRRAGAGMAPCLSFPPNTLSAQGVARLRR